MNEIAGFTYTTAEFDEDGTCLKQPVLAPDIEEIVIVSHGWNNNRQEAEDLYRTLFTNVARASAGRTRKLAIMGVLWPSKTFDVSDDGAAAVPSGQVGAAAAGGVDHGAEQVAIAHAFQQFEQVYAGTAREAAVAELRTILPLLAEPDAQRRFVEQLRDIVAPPASRADFDGSRFFAHADARDVFANARQASADVANQPRAGGAVAGAGLGTLFSGLSNAVTSLLNIGTYYEMKKRAGTVGTVGLAPLIETLAQRDNLAWIHLVGHSFGARLVTAAAMSTTTPKLYSLCLLQAAFSHNGFSAQGFFNKVFLDKRLAGPIVITYSRNDKAVGKAYAIASRIAKDSAAGVGGAKDKYGGLGANGAVGMAPSEVSQAATAMLPEQGSYRFTNQLIHNIESTQFIGSHGDVAGPQVAWLISQAIGTAS